ncbi:carboxyl-terminal processing protease [Tenacibaculum adriaticum]|uniref:Carboxyl-terminal processing protease n=1 Tax=Tenacibaculum adriaticum TaxID=413713 RepID=A0A5S5DVP2_9FLAO|nr:S41 family peptidase [Tenacibaculum adriaticum]TYP99905.1 carboxyl-terminal processing protease [Tenacibaculum adriaticum]
MKAKKILILSLVALITVSFSFQSRFFEIAKQIEIYNNLFKTLNMNYVDEINPGDLTNKAINNTLKNLDPYTRFYNEQQMEDALIRREGEYGGIGISSFYTKKGIVVADIKEGYPADKAGLKAGDVIFNVNGQNIGGLEDDQLSQMLKGSPNTPVNLKVKRAEKTIPFDLTLDKIMMDPVPFYEMINEDTGYIILTQFTNYKATEGVTKAFKELKEKGMKKLVFDLRNNPGGSLYDAVNITNLFIPMGKKVVDTRGKSKKNSRTYNTSRSPLDLEMPMVVLINGRSASASEIVSGALQDYDRAVIMGERSFGKGLVQRYFKLNYGTQMKATISKYYTPSGRCIQELDYANRDAKTGGVPKFSDGIVNKFSTENGRPVLDGGGVLPDVKIDISEKTAETNRLLNSKAIFNFATEYARKNPSINLDTFTFSSSDFNQFKEYLITKDTTFTSQQEKLFITAYESEENNSKISSEYNHLITKLKSLKIAEITKNEDLLTSLLQDEIIERYFYKKGVYQYQLKNDIAIKKASELLNNNNKYNNFLGK